MPRSPNPHPFPHPRQAQQLDRPVRPRDEVRLAPPVIDGAVSPMPHRANGKHDPCLRICAKYVGKRAVEGLCDFVDRYDAAVEEVCRELVAVGHVFAGLLGTICGGAGEREGQRGGWMGGWGVRER